MTLRVHSGRSRPRHVLAATATVALAAGMLGIGTATSAADVTPLRVGQASG